MLLARLAQQAKLAVPENRKITAQNATDDDDFKYTPNTQNFGSFNTARSLTVCWYNVLDDIQRTATEHVIHHAFSLISGPLLHHDRPSGRLSVHDCSRAGATAKNCN